MFTKGDFHIHSTASDGEFTPTQIIILAKKLGVDTIAITDHNSTSGVSEGAYAGKQYGVSIIPAVELSTKYKGESIHLLGYFKNTNFYSDTFQEILWLISTHKFNRVKNILSNFMYIDYSYENLSVNEGISLLRSFGAAVVLAHPVRISKRNLPEILNFSFDGLEAKYCKTSFLSERFFINMALSKFSFYTAGSDFHSNRLYHKTHCFIGEPFLNQMELGMFLQNSKSLVLGI